MKKYTNWHNDALSVLAEIFRLLSTSDHLRENIDEALGCMARFLAAPLVVIFRKEYEKKSDFFLECLGSWDLNSKAPADEHYLRKRWGFDLLSPDQWNTLESHNSVYILGDFIEPDKGPAGLVPIFLKSSLFGFIMLRGIDEKLFQNSMKLLENICRAMEAWIVRLDSYKRLSDFIDFVPHPIMTVDASRVITGWSKASEEMTGWKREDMLGRGNYTQGLAYYGTRRPTIPDLILNPDPGWENTYPKFKRDGDKVYSLSYCPAVIGGGAYLKTKTTLLYDLNSRVCGDIHIVEDMTTELKMEENLHRSESMYRAITDFAGVGIMVLTMDSIIYYNEHFVELLKASEEKISLDVLRRWIRHEDRERVFGFFTEVFEESKNVERFEFSAGLGEQTAYYKGYARHIQYDGIPAIHFIADDITKQREIAAKARHTELQMYHEDRLAALGIMSAGIAHELSQPLNHMRMTVDGLTMGREQNWELTSDDFNRSLRMVSRQVVRMSQIIENIRSFSKMDHGKSIVEVNVNDAVENVFCMIGKQIEAHGICLHKQLSPSLPFIRMARNRMEQVVLNLVVNARQALDQSRREQKNLWAKTGINGEKVFLEIKDNAFGVPEDIHALIFEPFFTTKEVDGTGLGLTIVKSIMEEFEGKIEVYNNEHGGATFIATCPSTNTR